MAGYTVELAAANSYAVRLSSTDHRRWQALSGLRGRHAFQPIAKDLNRRLAPSIPRGHLILNVRKSVHGTRISLRHCLLLEGVKLFGHWASKIAFRQVRV